MTAQADRLRRQLAPFAGKKPVAPAVAVSDRRRRVPGPPAGSRRDDRRRTCRCAASRSRRPARTTRTPARRPRSTPALTTTAASLYAFQRDLEARGVADRVLTLVWSEFGRRAQENGSGGTDHGAAGTGFLIGTRAAGTQVGEFPGLASGLDADGNLKATSDFRGVYASLLEQWLSFDAARVIPDAQKFKRPQLVK